MEKIAFNRLNLWISDAWDEYKKGFSNLLPYGAIVFGLSMAVSIISQPIAALLNISPTLYGVGMVFIIVIHTCVQGISQTVLSSVGLARWHGRNAAIDDAKLDISTHVQGILGVLIASFFTAFIGLLGCLPGIALIIAGVFGEMMALVGLGVILLLVIGLPILIITPTLFFFTIPLIIDKQMGFWSALMHSIDCVRRDLLGMIIFSFIFSLFYGVVTMCTCSFGLIFLAPFFGLLRTRAYRDYFGLEEDQIAARNPHLKLAQEFQPQRPTGPNPTGFPQPPAPQPQHDSAKDINLPEIPSSPSYGNPFPPKEGNRSPQSMDFPPLPPPPPGLNDDQQNPTTPRDKQEPPAEG